jgi:putative multicomponent Na+:H+ antiporter subunit B
MEHLRDILKKRYMRLECITYPNPETLQQALVDKDVHGTCVELGRSPLLDPHRPTLPHPETPTLISNTDNQADFLLTVRIHHLYNILSVELPPSDAVVTYAKIPENSALAANVLNPKSRELAEEQL